MNRQIGILYGPHSRMLHSFKMRVTAAVREYFVGREDCRVHLFDMALSPVLEAIRDYRMDGAIVIGLVEEDIHVMEELAQASIAAVHAGQSHTGGAFHEVRAPDVTVGEAGARHLMALGLRHFAFVGEVHQNSVKRCEGFVSALAKAGHRDVMVLADNFGVPGALDDLLRSVPKPVGIMAVSDEVSWLVARQAFFLGLSVPDQLAIIGYGNEDPWCTLGTPTLSSIQVPARAIGMESAKMLDGLMAGRCVPPHIDVLPGQVIERESTVALHGATAEIAAAVRYMRQNFRNAILAGDVAEFAGISRSTLQRGIKDALGRSPLQEILRLRFAAVKELLADTDLPVKIVAARCGFPKSERLSAAFRTAFGMTPLDYRRQQRGYPVLAPPEAPATTSPLSRSPGAEHRQYRQRSSL